MTLRFFPNATSAIAAPIHGHWHWLSAIISTMRRDGQPVLSEAHNSLAFSSAILTDPIDGSQYMVTVTPMGDA